MNKKLLLFCSTLLVSVATFAQWTKPVPASTAALEVSDGDTRHYYYLYNKDAKAFFSEGNAWGTQASIGTPALKVYFSKYLQDGVWDEKTYIINDSSFKKKAWKQLFIDSETQLYVDRYAQANYLFEFEDQGDNVFRIAGAEANPDYSKSIYENCYVGFDHYDGALINGPLAPVLNITDVEAGHTYQVDWQLVTPEVYDAMAVQYAAYFSAEALKVVIDSASVHNIDINLTGIKNVYDNTKSTATELDSVKATLNAAIDLSLYITEIATTYPTIDATEALYLLRQSSFTKNEVTEAKAALQTEVRKADVMAVLDGASEDNPKSATSLLTNPDFSAGNANGWTNTFVSGTNATNVGYQSSSYTNGDVTISGFIEAWAEAGTNFNKNITYRAIGDGELSQTVLGLPAGKYLLTGDFIAVNQDGNSAPVTGVQLFANGGGLDMFKTISTGNELPEHIELTFISGGGDLTMGLRTSNATANWIAGDNFTLTYYGEVSEDPYKVILDETIKQAETKYANLDDVRANAKVKEAFTKMVESAKAATDDYQAVNEDLNAAVKDLDNSVKEYVTLAGFMEENLSKQTAFAETSFAGVSDLLGDLYMEWEDKYNEGTATSEYIASAEQQMSEVIVKYITANVKEGDEITAIITNPDFDTRFSGWSTTGATPAWGGKDANTQGTLSGITLESGNAEVYQQVFDMYQVIKNMPKGSYKLTAQAFERNDGIGTTKGNPVADYNQYGDENLRAVIYADDVQTKVSHIYKYATTDQLFSDGSWFSDVNVGTETEPAYIPNGMNGANYHFYNNDKQDYVVSLYFSVKEDGDSVRIGIKTTATTGWVIFDNFRLYYQGAGAESYKDQIDALTKELQDVFNDATYYGNDAEKMATAAITAMADAYKAGDGDACMKAVAAANEALTYAKTSVKDYQNLSDSYDALNETLETYQDIASDDIINKALVLSEDIEAGLNDLSFTNKEAEDLYKQATLMATAIKTSAKLNEAGVDTSKATEENPVNVSIVIENATFDVIGDFTGWSGSSFGAGGETSTCAERYEMDYDTYQDLGGLPAGFYILKADGFYRRGSAANDYEIEQANPDSARFAKLYATSSVSEVSVPVACISSAALTADKVTEIGSSTDKCATVGEDLYVPNLMTSGNSWFEAGYYDNETPVIEVGEDGVLRIGVKTEGRTGLTTDWSIFDNFELYYLGTTVTGIDEIGDVEEVTVKGIYNLAGQKLSAPQKGINIIDGKKVLVK